MDAIKFIKERDRMCKSYYDAEKGRCSDGCPAHDVQCSDLDDLSTDAEELVTLVEEWSAAHQRKTRQSVFLEQWPQADIDNTRRKRHEQGRDDKHSPEVVREDL